jgi:hypothetical protein
MNSANMECNHLDNTQNGLFLGGIYEKDGYGNNNDNDRQ